jgi:hypothetical protein
VDTESGTVTWPGGIDLAHEPLYEHGHAHRLSPPDRRADSQLASARRSGTKLDKIRNTVHCSGRISKG